MIAKFSNGFFEYADTSTLRQAQSSVADRTPKSATQPAFILRLCSGQQFRLVKKNYILNSVPINKF